MPKSPRLRVSLSPEEAERVPEILAKLLGVRGGKRPGAGRPKLPKKEKKVRVVAYVDASTAKEMKGHAGGPGAWIQSKLEALEYAEGASEESERFCS